MVGLVILEVVGALFIIIFVGSGLHMLSREKPMPITTGEIGNTKPEAFTDVKGYNRVRAIMSFVGAIPFAIMMIVGFFDIKIASGIMTFGLIIYLIIICIIHPKIKRKYK